MKSEPASFSLRIDLNADVGEGAVSDSELFALITSANIACGGHAGDDDSMRTAIALALKHGVAIGAHPSYADRANFGRRELDIKPAQLARQLLAQIQTLQRAAASAGARLRHVKPHGALYNRAARDEAMARAVLEAIRQADAGLALFALASSPLVKWAREANIAVAEEVFADRGYRADGSLVPRGQPGALVKDPQLAAQRVERMIVAGTAETVDGGTATVRADTVCLHGDEPEAVAFARTLRNKLQRRGIAIAKFEGA